MQLLRRLTSIIAALVAVLALSACGGAAGDSGAAGDDGTAATGTEATSTETASAITDTDVTFGRVEWPGVTVKSQVAAQILSELGYETNVQSLAVPTVLSGLSKGDLDAFLAVWRPSMTSQVEPYLDDGTISIAATNLEETLYKNAVPSYVAEDLGVTSMADLDENREAFGGTIYGIEPGNDGNQIIKDAISNDMYGLGDWELRPSSTSAMLAEVGRKVSNEEPIVFLGWKPHWMNVEYDLTYLEDPEGIWGGPGHVETAVHSDLEESNPNVHQFLSQMKVSNAAQDQWILEYGKNGEPADEVARTWIGENLDTVDPWVEGVTSVDGEPAADVLSEAFGS